MLATPKEKLRIAARRTRRAIPVDQRRQASEQICERLLALHEISSANVLFVYVSYLSEVSTHDLIERLLRDGKTLVVPKIVGYTRMIPVEIKGLGELHKSEHDILEPADQKLYLGPIDVCITPGLAFTIAGDRLGFGHGYYDRFLSRYNRVIRIAPAFECQLVEYVPTDENDQTMRKVVTEKRVIRGCG